MEMVGHFDPFHSPLTLLEDNVYQEDKQHKQESDLNKHLILDILTGNSVMLNKSNKDKIEIFSTEK